jgi:hypothetical protein
MQLDALSDEELGALHGKFKKRLKKTLKTVAKVAVVGAALYAGGAATAALAKAVAARKAAKKQEAARRASEQQQAAAFGPLLTEAASAVPAFLAPSSAAPAFRAPSIPMQAPESVYAPQSWDAGERSTPALPMTAAAKMPPWVIPAAIGAAALLIIPAMTKRA